MTTNQKVWLISFLIVIACLVAALLIYLYTGQIVIAIFIVPPLIHYILKKRMGKDDGY